MRLGFPVHAVRKNPRFKRPFYIVLGIGALLWLIYSSYLYHGLFAFHAIAGCFMVLFKAISGEPQISSLLIISSLNLIFSLFLPLSILFFAVRRTFHICRLEKFGFILFIVLAVFYLASSLAYTLWSVSTVGNNRFIWVFASMWLKDALLCLSIYGLILGSRPQKQKEPAPAEAL